MASLAGGAVRHCIGVGSRRYVRAHAVHRQKGCTTLNNSRYDAVIFDLFGTLVGYLPDAEYDAAWARIASALGAPVDALRRIWGSTLEDRDVGRFGSIEGDIRNAVRLLGISPSDDQIFEAVTIRRHLYGRAFRPREGAIELLTGLRADGLKTAVITVCGFEVADIWRISLFTSLVDTVIFSCVEGLTKPDPRIYLLACERLGVRPERALYVGDGSYTELAGAQAVGMHPVLITRAFTDHTRDDIGEVEAWHGPRVSSLAEVYGEVTNDQ